MWEVILLSVLSVYIILSVTVYFLANSNIIPSRRYEKYELKFGAEMRKIKSAVEPELEVAYWVARQDGSDKNVVLLHGFTRNSKNLESRAEIYWKLGYNIYFVDNLGHGYSSDQLYPSGYRYSREVKNVILAEEIREPVIHGLSMGSIAANVIGLREPEIPKALVCEALPINFDNLYSQLLRYLRVPPFLFPWIEWLSKKLNWKQFEKMELSLEDYRPWEVDAPLFLIHSTTDRLFDYRDHFEPLVERMEDKKNLESWLVPNASHTKMVRDDRYADRLENFLENYG